MSELKKPQYCGDYIRWKYVKKVMPKGKGLCLDLGCGLQEYKDLVESKGYEYLGVDLYLRGNTIVKEDAENLSFPNSKFNCVLLIDVLEHVQNPEKVFSEVFRVLKSGGCFIIHTPNISQTHILVKPKEQADHVRKGFTFTELWNLFDNAGFRKGFQKIDRTFDPTECIAWEFVYASMHNIPVDVLKIVDFDWDKYENLGWIGLGRKP